jgi:hypothetical protein
MLSFLRDVSVQLRQYQCHDHCGRYDHDFPVLYSTQDQGQQEPPSMLTTLLQTQRADDEDGAEEEYLYADEKPHKPKRRRLTNTV